MSRYRERSSALQRLARSLRIALAALAVTGITERDGAGQEGSRRIKAPAGLDPVARAVPARRATVSDRVEKYLKANLENLPEVRAASFRDITPGQTSRASLQKTLGEPSESKTDGATEKWAYKVGPFPRVEFQLRGQTVERISIRLAVATPIENIEQDLQLSRFTPAPKFTANGEPLGLVYPERGMELIYESPVSDPPLVERVVLRSVEASDFIDRIRFDRAGQFRQQLADAHQALTVEPGNEEAVWMTARTLAAVGFHDYARKVLERACEQGIDTPRLRLEAARLALFTGAPDEGRRQTEAILARHDLSPLIRARAELQMGDMLAHASSANYKMAVSRYMTAIQTAVEVTKEGPFAHRREARQLIFDAHLGVAHAIARGGFRNKVEIVQKWLSNADALAERMQASDYAPVTLDLQRLAGHLRIYAAMDDACDPQPAYEALIALHNDVKQESDDELFLRYLGRMYGEALLDAAAVFQRRGAVDLARAAASHAVEALSAVAQQQPPQPKAELLLGRACFVQGALCAVLDKDHAAAARWYDRAWPLLTHENNAELASDPVLLGEQLVSMGISYWETRDTQRATEATRRGAELLAAAADKARAEPALHTAYSNLAAMHEALGATEQAASYAELARQLDSTTSR